MSNLSTDRYCLFTVPMYPPEGEDMFGDDESTEVQVMIDMFRIESFYESTDGRSVQIKMYSGDYFVIGMTFREFERIWREYAGGKIQLFA